MRESVICNNVEPGVMQILRLILDVQRVKDTFATTTANINCRVLVVRPREADRRCPWAIDGRANKLLSAANRISGSNIVQMHAVRAAIREFRKRVPCQLMLQREAPELSLSNIDVLVYVSQLRR